MPSGISLPLLMEEGHVMGWAETVKRLAAKASLQRPYEDQILKPYQLYLWAKENIQGITFAYVDAAEVQQCAGFLQVRFAAAMTVQGTNSCMPSIRALTNQHISWSNVSLRSQMQDPSGF